MKIYDYDRIFSPYKRLWDYEMISRNKLYIIKINYFTALILKKSIHQNRPFKVLYYTISTSLYDSSDIQQDIIANNRYLLERKKYINDFRDELKEYINYFRDKSFNSKFTLTEFRILYRILNHFIHKNRKRR